jgi:hypothetical protein
MRYVRCEMKDFKKAEACSSLTAGAMVCRDSISDQVKTLLAKRLTDCSSPQLAEEERISKRLSSISWSDRYAATDCMNESRSMRRQITGGEDCFAWRSTISSSSERRRPEPVGEKESERKSEQESVNEIGSDR